MTIGYIRSRTIIEQSLTINKMNELGVSELYIEPINGHLKKEIFDDLLNVKFNKLVIKNLSELPLPSNKAIDFLAFLDRQKVEIELIDGSIDMRTILELEKLNKANSNPKIVRRLK